MIEQLRPEHSLTGQQRMRVLDGLLYYGMEAIIVSTRFLETHIVSVLAELTSSKRRKLFNAHTDVHVPLLQGILLSEEPQYQLRAYMELRPDRKITRGILSQFVTATEGYETWEPEQRAELEHQMLRPEYEANTLFGAVLAVREALVHAEAFRNLLLVEYYNLCRLEASKLRRKSPHVSEGDLTHNLCHGVATALDKYNHDNGALTPYVRLWLRFASQSPLHPHEVGLAYDVPWARRVQLGFFESGGALNKASSLETLVEKIDTSAASEVEQEQEVNEVHRLAKYADPEGYVRIGLGYDEVLTPEIRRQIARHVNHGTTTAAGPLHSGARQ